MTKLIIKKYNVEKICHILYCIYNTENYVILHIYKLRPG